MFNNLDLEYNEWNLMPRRNRQLHLTKSVDPDDPAVREQQRRREGLAAVALWENDHGRLTAAELRPPAGGWGAIPAILQP
jgi:hypothetical protein